MRVGSETKIWNVTKEIKWCEPHAAGGTWEL